MKIWWNLVEPERTLKQCKTRVQQLETCHKINSLLISEFNLANLLDTIMNTAKEVMEADASSLLLIDQDHGDLVFQVALGGVGNQLKTLQRLKLGEGIAGKVAETGEALIIKDAYEYPQFNPSYDKKTGFKTGSILCAPLKIKGEILGVCQVIHSRDSGKVFHGPDLGLFQMFCDSAALALQNARMHQSLMERQKLEKDMEFARSVQESFLPSQVPIHDQFLFAAQTVPALDIGGDFYDFIPLEDETLGVILGDVSGKGVPAALQMARLMSDFRYISLTRQEPKDILFDVNNIFCERSYRGMFTTVAYLLINMRDRTVRVSNGGHHPLMIIDQDGNVTEKGIAGGTPLGIIPNAPYQQEEFSLNIGDRVFLYTDGLVEPRNPEGEPFGIERLKQNIKANDIPPQGYLEQLNRTLSDFTGDVPQFDDFTFLMFQTL